eukprot:CAMPEP_0204873996 /NCGR_PEP_ID=MMETSP1348-20121228/42158_1 /ASSEMBLY_ACC=CAM_ASM_000700 /TAXON_ID=215587 /ORGANISM="Aplanochytrium stocchinoi, Strain GSBS06" /LENGTH=334 /DNA_ID=CAMNT_0052029599 /DNA_START=122 /DNA_END=1126 /DNA_ORIENTATION=+
MKEMTEELNLEECSFYAFPTLDQLYKIQEEELRNLGFGYRAKFITSTVTKLHDLGGTEFLHNLRESKGFSDLEHIHKCRASLIQFHGVGRKVADCVALFSLDCTGCIPVDTHVWQIACRYYDPSLLESKSLTPKIYERVNTLFIDRFGSYAGWAHSVLFAAELPLFRDSLPKSVIAEMDKAKLWEAQLKKNKKKQKAATKVKRKKEKIEGIPKVETIEEDAQSNKKSNATKERKGNTNRTTTTKLKIENEGKNELGSIESETENNKKSKATKKRIGNRKRKRTRPSKIAKGETEKSMKQENAVFAEEKMSTPRTIRRKTRASKRTEIISHHWLS